MKDSSNPHPFPCHEIAAPAFSRRDFLRRTALGFGSLAFSCLMSQNFAVGGTSGASVSPLASKPPHFPARAKRVIMIFLEGGLSHHDTIDYKPDLIRFHGHPLPESLIPSAMKKGEGEKLEFFGTLKAPVADFRRRGESGLWISDAFSEIGSLADDLCILNGMVTDSTEHLSAKQQMHTGMTVLPRPSMGAWLLYGLGTENQNIPGFVVVSAPNGSTTNCGTGFLPGVYQATMLRDAGKKDSEMIRYLFDNRLPREVRRRQLDLLAEMNRDHLANSGGEPILESMIESNELAFRMQTEAPDILDIDRESEATKRLYGIGQEKTDSFGRQCLIARRFAEAGTRFVQVTSENWDHHDTLVKRLPESCYQVDRPIAGLIADLKSRGMLEDTLVLITGEFGRTPTFQRVGGQTEKPPGRGHNPFGWSLLLAGGGVKGGFNYGSTDEFGYSAVDGRVHVHDLHATILHLLGLDHERLTYTHAGRPYRLTDVYGNVVKGIIA